MIVSVHQPHYLPWLGYFHKIMKSDCFVFLDNVQYKHREYQSRNRIRTKDGWVWLTVPVLSKGLGRQIISEVMVDNSVNWQEKHWRSLKNWYGKAKFFADYAPFFEKVYMVEKWERLIDLNVCIIRYILNELSIETPLHFESDISTTKKSTERIIEICKKLKADTYLSGIGGKDYLEEEKFAGEGIELRYQIFDHPVYCQRFAGGESNFVTGMASVDLLFNEGPTSGEILKKGVNE